MPPFQSHWSLRRLAAAPTLAWLGLGLVLGACGVESPDSQDDPADLASLAGPKTIHATSLNRDDVAKAIDQANDGDTIILPAGVAVWTQMLTITKSISLIGAGMDSRLTGQETEIIADYSLHDQLLKFDTTFSDHTIRFSGVHLHVKNFPVVPHGVLVVTGTARTHLVNGSYVGGVRVDHIRWTSEPMLQLDKAGTDLVNGNYAQSSPRVWTKGGDPTTTVALMGASGFKRWVIASGTTKLYQSQIVSDNDRDPVSGKTYSAVNGTLPVAVLNDDNVIAKYIFMKTGYVTGVMDHCYVDYPVTASSSEIMDISSDTSPTGDVTPPPFNSKAAHGAWSMYRPYVYGGGVAVNGDDDAFYLEDNIFHHNGATVDSLAGGGRYVARYNVSWGHFGGHGSDGQAFGKRAVEIYNNHMCERTEAGRNSFSPFGLRGGGAYIFNNRITNWPANDGFPAVSPYRMSGAIGSQGGADGTNWFDLNAKGSISFNGYSFNPVATARDPRSGDIYARGTGATVVQEGKTLTMDLNGGLAGGQNGPDKWVGFVIRNLTYAPPEALGGQGSERSYASSWAYITASTEGANTTLTLFGGGQGTGPFPMSPTDKWEIRRVLQAANLPGSGRMDSLFDGTTLSGSNVAPTLVPGSGPVDTPAQRWTHQAADGIWIWSNSIRDAWSDRFHAMGAFVTERPVVGGIHDQPKASYRTSSAPRRIGADWKAPGYTDETIPASDPDAATASWGAVYPYPLVH